MPIYEYRCGACGHELEIMQKMSDEPITDCPLCGKATLVKVISAAGFQLKGSGWYVTDFRDSKKPKKGDADSGKKTETGSESKQVGAGDGGGKDNKDSKATDTTKSE
ncbi:MAG: zinc ribbon domain-containing protein [Burkholderiales bacterium]|nr:zinc ribbon domain-containing protein [Burkholderiales bacterium]